ncbi:MAG: hypothetical protein KF716_23835 [Anaerolineae bacterium]|nr:hypothetical protein [Anaerolineae bacterium]
MLWGIGILFYGVGNFCEAYYGTFGWDPLIFRLWYLFGAILVAAWLGQGTVYLLARRRVAHALMVILVLGSLYAAYRIFAADLDPALMIANAHSSVELNGYAIVTPGVRTLTPFFNIYGTITLAGGAAYSAWLFWRKRVLLHRTIGNILIAAGAMAPALGGTFSRLGMPSLLYIAELVGILLMLVGFLRATSPLNNTVNEKRPVSADGIVRRSLHT